MKENTGLRSLGSLVVTALTAIAVTSDGYAMDCGVNPEKMRARFTLEKTWHGGNTAEASASTTQLGVWRRGEEVAHELEDQQITEIWNRLPNGRVRPVRYFDEYRRGIEYQPNEVSGSSATDIWAKKTQLVTNSQKESMTLIKTEGKGCDKIEYYRAQGDGVHYLLHWSPVKALPVRYREVTKQYSFTATLAHVDTSAQQVDRFFGLRDGYQTTDYADIGDNEHDPFLIKMINLGFVSHGASGFYNANGDSLEPASHHHGH